MQQYLKRRQGHVPIPQGLSGFSQRVLFSPAFLLPPVFSIIFPQVNLYNDSCVFLLGYKPLNTSVNNSNNKKVDILSPNRKMLRSVRPFVTLPLPRTTPRHWCIDTMNTV